MPRPEYALVVAAKCPLLPASTPLSSDTAVTWLIRNLSQIALESVVLKQQIWPPPPRLVATSHRINLLIEKDTGVVNAMGALRVHQPVSLVFLSLLVSYG